MIYKIILLLFILLIIPNGAEDYYLYAVFLLLALLGYYVNKRFKLLFIGLLPLVIFAAYKLYVYL